MEFSDYDIGWRHGTFDKCNGVATTFGPDEADPWTCGYFDAYNTNENRMVIETDQERDDRLEQEAYDAGRAMGREFRKELIEKSTNFSDNEFLQDTFWNGCVDEL